MFGLKFPSSISRSGKSYSVGLGSPGGLGAKRGLRLADFLYLHCGFGLTRKLGDKLTQMRSELDQLGPFLMPPLLVIGRVTDITCVFLFPITFSSSILVLKPLFCISNRLEQKQTPILELAFWLFRFTSSTLSLLTQSSYQNHRSE
jgi:hypothetical protein